MSGSKSQLGQTLFFNFSIGTHVFFCFMYHFEMHKVTYIYLHFLRKVTVMIF